MSNAIVSFDYDMENDLEDSVFILSLILKVENGIIYKHQRYIIQVWAAYI